MADAAVKTKSTPDFVQSLARGLAVIEAFSNERRELTLSDVAVRTGLTRATARRFLHTLRDLGYVGFDGKYFGLKPRVLCLGYAYLSSMNIAEIAEPFMERVVSELHESCSASVLDGTDVVYVVRVPTKRIMTIALTVGSRLPAYATSMGRVLLANLSPAHLDAYFRAATLKRWTPHTVADEREIRRILAQVAKQQYAVLDQELEEGLRSIAVPIRDYKKQVVAAINCSTHTNRTSAEDLVTRFLPVLREAADSISHALSGR